MTSIAIRPPQSQPLDLWRRVMAFLAHAPMRGQPEESRPLTDEPAAEAWDAEQLLDRYGNHILRLAYSYLHNMADAEDILQDTMIQYLRSRPSFETSSCEKAWFMRVAANLSKNKIRYETLRKTDELSETLHGIDRQDLSFVWEAVKKLPVRYREAVHLYYYEGYSTLEIAQILERKESTVRSDLRRGRQALKEILKEEYDFEQSV